SDRADRELLVLVRRPPAGSGGPLKRAAVPVPISPKEPSEEKDPAFLKSTLIAYAKSRDAFHEVTTQRRRARGLERQGRQADEPGAENRLPNRAPSERRVGVLLRRGCPTSRGPTATPLVRSRALDGGG